MILQNKIFHTKERKVIQGYMNSFNKQLKEIPKNGKFGAPLPLWVSINAKKELCEELLGYESN